MEYAYIIVRYVHITAGVIAFFVAPIALIAKKGGGAHILWGNVFFWAMLGVSITAVPMSIYRPTVFLLLVAIFSSHLAIYGYRATASRKPTNAYKKKLTDLYIALGSLVIYLLLIGWGIHTIFKSNDAAFGYIAIVFGAVGMRFSISQLHRLYRPAASTMDWWYQHMQGMVGAYIAAVSAFSAVNLYFLPPIIRWLWPTVVGSIGLSVWIRYYRKKFRKTSARAAGI